MYQFNVLCCNTLPSYRLAGHVKRFLGEITRAFWVRSLETLVKLHLWTGIIVCVCLSVCRFVTSSGTWTASAQKSLFLWKYKIFLAGCLKSKMWCSGLLPRVDFKADRHHVSEENAASISRVEMSSTVLCNNPKGYNVNSHRRENLKSYDGRPGLLFASTLGKASLTTVFHSHS
jgi:hypothetical protein